VLVLKRKQIVALSLVLMVMVAGYLGFFGNDPVNVSEGLEEGQDPRLGEAVYVERDMEVSNQETLPEQNVVQASKEVNDFFASAKMDREISRGRDQESLEQISTNLQIDETIKNQAHQKMLGLIENSDKEMRLETLIKERGFADSVVMIADDGSVDVVVKSKNLSTLDVAQIADIVSRQAKVDISNIHIRNLF
jgi:stage III sporulation protein AH